MASGDRADALARLVGFIQQPNLLLRRVPSSGLPTISGLLFCAHRGSFYFGAEMSGQSKGLHQNSAECTRRVRFFVSCVDIWHLFYAHFP
jgi:hypothetical protein